MNAVPQSIPDAPPATGAGPTAAFAHGGAPWTTSDYHGFRLASHFQPIFSLTHHRVVGHEALLRATALPGGAAVAPMDLFAHADGDAARVALDRAALMQHLAAYAGRDANEWLFLNMHPRSLVSLLHECGCLVLMEGIETDEGAYIALRCDVDFVQGYHFGRPAPGLAGMTGLHALRAAWDRFDRQSVSDDRLWQEQMSPYKQSIELASVLLAGGASMDEACRRFLSQPGAEMCYLLDRQGRQVVGNAFREGLAHQQIERVERFGPLQDTRHARWSRRAYFRNAEAAPNFAQVTRPYMALQGTRMCVTVSIQFDMGGRSLILCGDASL